MASAERKQWTGDDLRRMAGARSWSLERRAATRAFRTKDRAERALRKAELRSAKRAELERFGKRVQELRVARGVTQEALAVRLGLSKAMMSSIERGIRNPPCTTVLALARELGADLGDFAV